MRIDTIVILAGGKGSRSLDPGVPKICQSISASSDIASFLLNQLAEFENSKIIWVVSHLADDVVQRLSPLRNNMSVVFDGGHGTARALRQASDQIVGNEIMILLGDCIMGLPLKNLVDNLDCESSTTFFGRETDHPEDSDVLALDVFGQVASFQPKGSSPNGLQGLQYGLSGITITSREVLEQPLAVEDFQLDIYLNSRKLQKPIYFMNNSWYVRDVGTPERLHRVRKDFESGVIQRRSNRLRPAIFLDRDGTIVPDQGEGRISILPEEVPDSVIQEIASANKQGVPIFLVTNQPGIAKGFIRFTDFLNSMVDLRAALQGAFFDDYYFCPHHPERGWAGEIEELKVECVCRKPEPGMLLNAAKEHLLDLSNSVLIGDSVADMFAAARAGTKFLKANWSQDGALVASSIRASIREISCDIS